jgi:hypothetical protein
MLLWFQRGESMRIADKQLPKGVVAREFCNRHLVLTFEACVPKTKQRSGPFIPEITQIAGLLKLTHERFYELSVVSKINVSP